VLCSSRSHSFGQQDNVDPFTTNTLSLYTIPFAWLTCIAPHVYAIKLYEHVTKAPSKDSSAINNTEFEAKEDFRFDKAQPRTFMKLLDRNPNPALTVDMKGRLAGLEAASFNGYENLGMFSSTVVAAIVGLLALSLSKRAEPGIGNYVWWMNLNSVGYVLCRVVFNVFYERGMSGIARGAWFYASVGCCFGLLIRAANLLVVTAL
jgi:uncharacterized MAPEG superfamily protein